MLPSLPPLYSGEFSRPLDDKDRLTIPSEWRYAHGKEDTFLATPSPGGYVAILPPAEVEKLRAKVAAIALSDDGGQDFVAKFFAQTQTLWIDKSGRVALKAELLAFGGIKGTAVLVGAGTKFHVYNPARWKQVGARTSGENFGDLMRRLGI